MRRVQDAQLFLFCEDCDKLDKKNKGFCSMCSGMRLWPIFVWVEERAQTEKDSSK